MCRVGVLVRLFNKASHNNQLTKGDVKNAKNISVLKKTRSKQMEIF